MSRIYHVYILSNQSRSLYVGVTNDLLRRWHEHRHGEGSTYCRRNHITRLVFAAAFARPLDAITQEKRLKGWTRAKKVALIMSQNPGWRDLAVDWGWREAPASRGARRIAR